MNIWGIKAVHNLFGQKFKLQFNAARQEGFSLISSFATLEFQRCSFVILVDYSLLSIVVYKKVSVNMRDFVSIEVHDLV